MYIYVYTYKQIHQYIHIQLYLDVKCIGINKKVEVKYIQNRIEWVAKMENNIS